MMPRKGYKFTDEQKKRLSESHKGKTPWNKGKRGLQSAWNKDMKGYTNAGTFKKGHSQSIEARKKMSLAKKGKPSPKKGIPLTQDTKLKLSLSLKGRTAPNKGKKMSIEARKKMSVSKKGKPSTFKGKQHSEKSKQKMIKTHNTPRMKEIHRKNRLHQVFPKKDTIPEIILQQELKKRKIVYETHVPLIGQPDIFIKPNVCIMADSDWYHGYKYMIGYDCSKYKKFNNQYFEEKIAYDKSITRKLTKDGYNVLRFWEHEIKNHPEKCLKKILKAIKA